MLRDERRRRAAVAGLDVAVGGLRLCTQSRKLRAWSAPSSRAWPSTFLASIIGLAPVRQPRSSVAVDRRAGRELVRA